MQDALSTLDILYIPHNDSIFAFLAGVNGAVLYMQILRIHENSSIFAYANVEWNNTQRILTQFRGIF